MIRFAIYLCKRCNRLTNCELLQALIWSKMSTGLPIEISSSMKNQSYTSFCRLDIDIHRYDLELGKFLGKSTFNYIKLIVIVSFNFVEIYHMCIYMKNETTRNGGMGLKFKLSLKGIGLLIV